MINGLQSTIPADITGRVDSLQQFSTPTICVQTGACPKSPHFFLLEDLASPLSLIILRGSRRFLLPTFSGLFFAHQFVLYLFAYNAVKSSEPTEDRLRESKLEEIFVVQVRKSESRYISMENT